MQRTKQLPQRPWVIVAPDGPIWLGHADGEARAWWYALGCPSPAEVGERKAQGWYAAEATVTWKRPEAGNNQ